MRLKGKVGLVSGAASGIGEATAKTFAREGAAVVVADLNEEGGRRVVSEIRQAGGTAEFVRCNIGRPAEVDAAFRFATDKFGQLDILHNNAIVFVPGRLGDVTIDQWQKAINVGLTSYWYCTKVALALMVPRGRGAIVNTASISGVNADYGLGPYNIIKAAVINMTRSTAIDYARKGIRCNCVCPGPIATPPLVKLRRDQPELMGRLADAIPMGRMGEPHEIANAVLFLASDEASFVTGIALVVDGGSTAVNSIPSLLGTGPSW
jgi:meso-butanediol dehydrogenase / (S,S)-butanediol dehydrogenase / diacetyl reductase